MSCPRRTRISKISREAAENAEPLRLPGVRWSLTESTDAPRMPLYLLAVFIEVFAHSIFYL